MQRRLIEQLVRHGVAGELGHAAHLHFSCMRALWVLTVLLLMFMRAAMSFTPRPSTRQRKTSSSRSESIRCGNWVGSAVT